MEMTIESKVLSLKPREKMTPGGGRTSVHLKEGMPLLSPHLL